MLFSILSVCDLFFTWLLLQCPNGKFQECNPLAAAWKLNRYGWSGLVVFKLLMAVTFMGASLYICHSQPRKGDRLVNIGCLVIKQAGTRVQLLPYSDGDALMKQAAILAVCLFWTSVAPAWGSARHRAKNRRRLPGSATCKNRTGALPGDAKAGTPATLPATLSAVRALKYFGATPPTPPPTSFGLVRSCWNEDEGSSLPHSVANPMCATSLGMMALVDLKAADQNPNIIARGMTYLGSHVKDYEDARIAAAVVESTKKQRPRSRNGSKSFMTCRAQQKAATSLVRRAARSSPTCDWEHRWATRRRSLK